jgi:simple sugar transport system ATP-binding protein
LTALRDLNPHVARGAEEATIILDLVADLKARGDVAIVIIAHNYAQALQSAIGST